MQRKLKKARNVMTLNQNDNAADKLAENMPDAAQRFAIEIVVKYVRRWKARDRSHARAVAKLAKAHRLTEEARMQGVNTPAQPYSISPGGSSGMARTRGRDLQTERSPAKRTWSPAYRFPFTSRIVSSAASSLSKDML